MSIKLIFCLQEDIMNRQDGSEVCENIVISSTVYSDCSAHSYGIQESTR